MNGTVSLLVSSFPSEGSSSHVIVLAARRQRYGVRGGRRLRNLARREHQNDLGKSDPAAVRERDKDLLSNPEPQCGLYGGRNDLGYST